MIFVVALMCIVFGWAAFVVIVDYIFKRGWK